MTWGDSSHLNILTHPPKYSSSIYPSFIIEPTCTTCMVDSYVSLSVCLSVCLVLWDLCCAPPREYRTTFKMVAVSTGCAIAVDHPFNYFMWHKSKCGLYANVKLHFHFLDYWIWTANLYILHFFLGRKSFSKSECSKDITWPCELCLDSLLWFLAQYLWV